MRRFAVIIGLSLCFGCGTPRLIVSAKVDRAVNDSFSFLRAYAVSPTRACRFFEGTDDRYAVLYVGFDKGTHYTRSATLRVGGHGNVERQEMSQDGELIWVADN